MKSNRKLLVSRRMIFVLGLALVISMTSSGLLRAQESLRIAAVVNEEIISAYDLQARIKFIILMSQLPKTQETINSLAPGTLRTLIDEKLKFAEAERLGISVSQGDMDNALSIVEKNNRLKPNTVISLLERNRIDPETLLDQVRSEIVWVRIVGQKHRNRITITDEEIDAAVAAEETTRNQPRYRLSEIVIPVDKPEDLPEVRQQVASLEAQLKSGADFSTLAHSFSQSPSASDGGNIGWIRQDQLPEEVRSSVMSLRPNQISRSIKITAGFVIFKLHQIKSGVEEPKPDALLTLSQYHLDLPQGAPEETVTTYLLSAGKSTKDISGCTAFEKAGKDTGSPLSGNMGTVNFLKLPLPLQEAVRALPIGKSSKPVRSPNGIIVLMICEREDIPAPDISVDRKKIETEILTQRLAVYARQEIRDLRRAAYIEIR